MERHTNRRLWPTTMVVALVVIGLACTSSAREGGASAEATAERTVEPQAAPVINHVTPARDSTGSAPARFVWTPVDGADRYAIGVWNEVDVLLWRRDDIPTASVERPGDLPLEPGTYFWSVSALRDGRQVAESGLSAFVVRTTPPSKDRP